MRIEIRIKPEDENELEAMESAKFIGACLDISERTITAPGQEFWIFSSVSRAMRVLKSVYEIEKVRLAHAQK